MSRLPRVTARRVLAALQRQICDHSIQRQPSLLQHRTDATRRIVVAVHSGDVPEGTVRDILKQARLSVEEFLALL